MMTQHRDQDQDPNLTGQSNRNTQGNQSHHSNPQQLDKLDSFQGIPTDVISIVDIFSRRKRFGLSAMEWSEPDKVPWDSSCFASDCNSLFVFGRETNDESDLSIYEWDEHTAAVRCKSQSFTQTYSQTCRGVDWDITVGVGRVFTIQRSIITPSIYQINCFNNRGFLENSFEINESYEKMRNIKIRVFNGFIWVSQRHLINRLHQTKKSHQTYLRKYSVDGKLISNFIINGNADIYCIDSFGYLYVCVWGPGSIYKFKLNGCGDECSCDGGCDGGQDHIIENPIEIIRTDIRYIFEFCCDPIWGSLIVLAKWDCPGNNFSDKYFIYEISKGSGETHRGHLQLENYNIRKICNLHDLFKNNGFGTPESGTMISNSSLIAAASGTILRMR